MRWLLVLGLSAVGVLANTEEAKLKAQLAQFAPVRLTADTSSLSKGDKAALKELIAAAKILDPLYLNQVWAGNSALKEKLAGDKSRVGKLRLALFNRFVGPWSRLDHDAPFIPGVPAKPSTGTFYPEGMKATEFEAWVATLSPEKKSEAIGFFSLIRRAADGQLTSIPYSEAYREYLTPAAKHLRKAAELTRNASLKKFLESRAQAFTSNDYFASDVAWMELDSPLDITFGPYETYEDSLFNYKAAFEAFICLRNEKETQKLTKFSAHLQELEDALPEDPKYRNPKLGAAAPIRVVDQVFASGDGRRGVMTAAFNLPNDDRIVKEKGSKRVMLKNVQEAKFSKVLVPISKVVLAPADQNDVAFDPFFTHILMHELMHGLGPLGAREKLKDLSSALEEAKADITGLWAMHRLMDKGVVDLKMKKSMYTTYLASSFRSVRFGVNEAHGKGVALQFNYLTDEGAFVHDPKSGTFRVDFDKVRAAVEKLSGAILTLQAEGDYAKAKAFLEKYAVIRQPMQQALSKLQSVPVDIAPTYPLAGE